MTESVQEAGGTGTGQSPPVPSPRVGDPPSISGSDQDRERRIDELSAVLNLRGAEIDALQVEVSKRTRPVYREPSTIVAVLALVVSVLATVLSSNYNQVQGEQQRTLKQEQERSRLTTLVQDINDDLSQGLDIGLIRSDLDEAGELIELLQGTPFESTPYDKIQVARGYTGSDEPGVAILFARQAEAQSQDRTLSEKVNAARSLGTALFRSGDAPGGRASYRRALDHVSQAGAAYDPAIQAQYRLELGLEWTDSELRAGDCPEAEKRVVDVLTAVAQFPPFLVASRAQLGADEVNSVQQACTPPSR